MKIICTICSKDKNISNELLPAYVRYSSPRISKIKKISDENSIPFFILSGKYGLVRDDELIPHYDDILLEKNIGELSKTVIKQIKEHGISEIDFYAKSKNTEGWMPYYEVMESSVDIAGIPLTLHTL